MSQVTFIQEYEALWVTFRCETDLPEQDPYPVVELERAATPTEALESLWKSAPVTQFLGLRGQEVVRRVRDWLRGPEQVAEAEHALAVELFDRWVAGRQESLEPEVRLQLLEQFERTVAGLAATIDQERPDDDPVLEFRIAWQEKDECLGCWLRGEAAVSRSFSVRLAVADAAELEGEFGDPLRDEVASFLLAELRAGRLFLPLLPYRRVSEGETRLGWEAPGRPGDAGLLLPDASSHLAAPDDEMRLREHVPQLAKIYDETVQLVARFQEVQLSEASAAAVPASEPAAVQAEVGRVEAAINDLSRLTSLSAELLCKMLSTPLEVILVVTSKADLLKTAGNWVTVLQQIAQGCARDRT